MTFDVTLTNASTYRPAMDGTTRTFKCTSYKIGGDRGIVEFNLKTLKIFGDAIYNIISEYIRNPTVLVDFGSVKRHWKINGVLIGTGNNPIDNVEEQGQLLQDFFDIDCFYADKTMLKIGNYIYAGGKRINYSTDGVEGKVNTYDIEWDAQAEKVLKVSFEFIEGMDFDIL